MTPFSLKQKDCLSQTMMGLIQTLTKNKMNMTCAMVTASFVLLDILKWFHDKVKIHFIQKIKVAGLL